MDGDETMVVAEAEPAVTLPHEVAVAVAGQGYSTADEPVTKQQAWLAISAALAVAFPGGAAAAAAAGPGATASTLKQKAEHADQEQQQQQQQHRPSAAQGATVSVIDGIDRLTQRMFTLLVGRVMQQEGVGHAEQQPSAVMNMAGLHWEALPDEQRKLFISAVQPIVLHLHTMQRRLQRPLLDQEILAKLFSMEVRAGGPALGDLLTSNMPAEVLSTAVEHLPREMPHLQPHLQGLSADVAAAAAAGPQHQHQHQHHPEDAFTALLAGIHSAGPMELLQQENPA